MDRHRGLVFLLFIISTPQVLCTESFSEHCSADDINDRECAKAAAKAYVENFKLPGQYFYDDDLMLNVDTPPEHVQKVMDMEMQETDIAVATFPKTGTTIMQEIIWLLRHTDEEKAKNHNYLRVPFVDIQFFDGINLFNNLEHPREFKTHLPYRYLPKQINEKKAKILYVYRNPKDALVSYYEFSTHIKTLGLFKGSFHDYFDLVYRVNNGIQLYGDMFKHYRDYWNHRNDPNVFITSYEKLVREPEEEIRRIADFAEVDYDDNLIEKVVEATRFEAMKKNPFTNFHSISGKASVLNPMPFMKKGKIGNWKSYFTVEESEQMDAMIEKELGDTGMEFIYE